MMERCQYTDVLAFLVIMLSLCLHPPVRRDIAMADTRSGAQQIPSPLRGPVFISTVYPVLEVDHDLVELIAPIADAYSFWGKTIIGSLLANEKTFFPAPLSYPYQFSQKGLQTLKEQLEQLSDVDPATIAEQTLPNIPQDQQGSYSAEEKKRFLIPETYISFQLKGWEHLEFMKFPTFLVLAFDHTMEPVRSVAEYRRLASHWQEKINHFGKLEKLRQVLGIAHRKGEWRNVPVLTFAGLRAYSEYDPDSAFNLRYFSWDEATPRAEVQARFLREVGLLGFSEASYTGAPVLRHCHGVSHEYDFPQPLWRFYYSAHPFFYRGLHWYLQQDGVVTYGREGSPHYGVNGALTRILRTALFINVTLPSMVDWSHRLNDELRERTNNLQKIRMELFNSFSHTQLNAAHHNIWNYTERYQKIIQEIDRIHEAHQSFGELLKKIRKPFDPMDDPSYETAQASGSEEEDFCLEFFHFHQPRRNIINDHRKSYEYVRQITNYQKSIEVNRNRFENETSSMNSLLESRRALLKDRNNTILAIIFPALGAVVFGFLLWYFSAWIS